VREQLRTGLARMNAALKGQNSMTAMRQIAEAQTALQAAERLLGRIPLSCDESKELRRAASQFRSGLRQFDGNLPRAA